MYPFTLAALLPLLARQTAASLERQLLDPSRPDDGAVVRADWGLDDPGGTAGLVALCLWTLALRERYPDAMPPEPEPGVLVERARRGADYLLRIQRPSGLTDLRDCNYDSSPDAGFILQSLCPALEQARPAQWRADEDWKELLEKSERFVRKMAAGTLAGGFHTPNHRWVIAAGLALAGRLFPDLAVRPTIDAYLAEGFDLDPDGAFLERSAGVYDAICDRSLLLLADLCDLPEARAAADANLRRNLYLLHADGTIETGLSRRQDYNAATVPVALAVPYLLSAGAEPNPRFVRAAEFLWEGAPPAQRDACGALQAVLRYGEPAPSATLLPDDFVRHFPANGLWRVRRPPLLSASAFRDSARLLRLRFGRAELAGLRISQSYFGVGQFIADRLEVSGDAATLRSEGRRHPYRPGYELPLGRPVPPERYEEMRAERAIRRVPPADSELAVEAVADGFELRYRTLDGLDRVTAQIALDFAPGGVWETGDTSLRPQPDQVIFLKRGRGAMRYGDDVIEIGPGADAHRMWQMRDAETAPGQVRVLLTFVTPVDHAFRIRCYRSPAGPRLG